jgi:hypothetical protein
MFLLLNKGLGGMKMQGSKARMDQSIASNKRLKRVARGFLVGALMGALLGGSLGLLAGNGASPFPKGTPFTVVGPFIMSMIGTAGGAAIFGILGALYGAGAFSSEETLKRKGGPISSRLPQLENRKSRSSDLARETPTSRTPVNETGHADVEVVPPPVVVREEQDHSRL